jgi:16S rRNA (guanine527-N7)-methyltransferase
MSPDRADRPEALDGIVDISRETLGRLETLVALVRKWQPAENLVAPSTLPAIWRRHVADSAQLAPLFPEARRWLDLGSGAGFPGLVIACLLANEAAAHVHLVESNQRKCAFLRRAIAETGARAEVHHGRIEAVLEAFPHSVDVVTARALAPLPRLLELAEPVLLKGAVGAFQKGREYEGEITEAMHSFDFDLIHHESRIDADGVILEVRGLRRKDRQAGP